MGATAASIDTKEYIPKTISALGKNWAPSSGRG